MSRSLRRLLTLVTALAGGSLGLANPISNGSFEAPGVGVGSFDTFASGSTSIPGWSVVGVNASLINGSYQESGILYRAQDGLQWIDLTGPGTNAASNGVSQTIETTIGQFYELSFSVGSVTDNATVFASTVDLRLNGGERVGFTSQAVSSTELVWQRFTVPFMATVSTTEITFLNGSGAFNNLCALDGVSITAVPEPGLLGLLAVGAALAYGLRRRSRRQG